MALVLHLHPLSSYCHKVLIGLYELGTPFEARIVDLGDPAARASFESLWPTSKIPLLVDEARGAVVPETSIMLEYADGLPGGRAQLLPSDADDRLQARLWDRLFDLYVMSPMQKIVGDRLRPEDQRDPRGVEDARATLSMAYVLVDQRMTDRTWAAGEAFSLADCAAAPALFYAGIVAPFPGQHPHLAAYFERLLQRPSVTRVLTEARPYFEYFPFRDAIPPRFLEETPIKA